MTSICRRVLFGLIVTAVIGVSAHRAAAQTYYAYYPGSTYTTYYSGWYPGYWLDRWSASWWGRPVTYASYYRPVEYASNYRPTYSVRYAPSYSYASSACTTCSYAPSGCTTCARPACVTACDPCGGCDPCVGCTTCHSCPTSVSSVSYQQSSDCVNCGVSATTVPRTSTPERQPSLAPGENPPPDRTFLDTEKPVTPEPDGTAADDEDSSASYFQAPDLLNPNDRSALQSNAPVWTAIYHKPVEAHGVTATQISRQQAEQDAVGWVSASQ